MYIINKIVGGCLNPLVIGMLLVMIGGVLLWRGWRKSGFGFLGASVVWYWIWSTPIMYRWMGYSLECEWPVVRAEDVPNAGAIVLLGGSMGANTNAYPYAEMWTGADRVWHAARLYKAGKAPLVIASGNGDRVSTLPLLRDFGVPESAVIFEDASRNTEENAKFVEKLLTEKETSQPQLPTTNHKLQTKKILLVTSANHMRRALLMYKKYAPNLEIIPAATDYEVTVRTIHPFRFEDIWPDADIFAANSNLFKERIGYWGYRLFR